MIARIGAACVALGMLAIALLLGAGLARQAERDMAPALAPQRFAEKSRGAALQRAALSHAELLPLYGSSELTVAGPWHASALLRDRPTGFTIFPIGEVGSAALMWTQAVAALGPDLRGKKIAISLPSRSFLSPAIDAHAYAANFSLLHANELAFSCHLNFALKQAIARRMLAYPATLESDPLLRFALNQLAAGGVAGRALYYTALPLGLLHTGVLRLRDHWDTWTQLRDQPNLRAREARPMPLDYAALAVNADASDRAGSAGNSFGFAASFWIHHAADVARQKGMYADGAAARAIDASAEWTDVELLLRVVRQLGGEPLLLATPFNPLYADHVGVDAAARQAQRDRLAALAAQYDARLVEFSAAAERFTINPAQHLSASGWLGYTRALEEFFAGKPAAAGS